MKTSVSAQAGSTLSIVIVGTIFGSAFLCIKILVEEMSLLHIVAGRLSLGALAVGSVLAATRRVPNISRSLLISGAVLALADALIPYLLISWGETQIHAGTAAVLISTMPLFTALFAHILARDERLSAGKLGGLTVGFAGVAILAGGDGAGAFTTPSAGAAAVVLAAMLYAGAAVYARRVLASVDAITLNAVKLTIGALVMIPLAVGVDGLPSAEALDARSIIALVWVGMVTTGLARIAYFAAVAAAGSVRASLVTYIVPVSGVALGCLVLGEPLRTQSIAGFSLVIVGVALVMYGRVLAHAISGSARRLIVRRMAGDHGGVQHAALTEGR